MTTSAKFSALLVVALLNSLGAQDQSTPTRFRANAEIVVVPVRVTDHRGKPINGLRAENFTVFDEQVRQPIVSLTGEDSPCSVVLVLDVSDSMRKTLSAFKDAVSAFLAESNPEDEFLLLNVSTSPAMISGFTTDPAAVGRALESAHAVGDTALIDTIHLGLKQMRWARRYSKALLILSDGMDNHSRYSSHELMREALETDAQVYSVIIDDGPATRKPIELAETRRRWSLFEELAEKTGGIHYRVRSVGEVKAAVAKAGAALRNEYVIGYQTPGPVGSGEWRRIRVKTEIPGARVSARNGYYCR